MPKSVSYALWSLEPYCLGAKLRALRTKKRLTLARLAAETGLSTALLSKLETDRMIPTLPTLATICRIYGVGLGHFFCEPDRHALSITRKAHLQGAARNPESPHIIPLNGPGKKRISATFLEITGDTPINIDSSNGETCAFVYVIEGRLQFSAGAMMEVLEAGDCAWIETVMSLAWSTSGKHPCRVLVIRPNA